LCLDERYLAYGTNVSSFDKDFFNLGRLVSPELFAARFAYLFNTFVDLANTQDYILYTGPAGLVDSDGRPPNYYKQSPDATYRRTLPTFVLQPIYAALYIVCAALLLLGGALGVFIESRTVAPDVLGYVSTVVRNSRHLRLPAAKAGGLRTGMDGGERACQLKDVEVMMQDVSKPDATTGKIALGMKKENARPLRRDRLYR